MEIFAELGNFCIFFIAKVLFVDGVSFLSAIAGKVDSISYIIIKKHASHCRRGDVYWLLSLYHYFHDD